MAKDYTDTFRGEKVLITGGLGFIGSNLARRLVDLGARVLIVDSLIPEYGGNLYNIRDFKDQVYVNISDVRDEHALKYLVKDQRYLFNLAGQTSHMDSMSDPYTDTQINAIAQLHILEACRKFNPDLKILFASTRQIYGKPLYLPVDEKHPLNPVDINGVNKLAGERFHLLYHDVYGIRCSILRLTNTIGPCMRVKDARQTFLGIWIKLLLEGKPFEVWDGHQLRDFSYVDDVAEAFLSLAADGNADGRVFNLGGDPAISLHNLADLLLKLHGSGEYASKEFPADRKRIDIGDFYADFSLIREVLGWEPQVPLEEALRRTLDYYAAHLTHYL
jgi:UDP-glucose 4-epimerase